MPTTKTQRRIEVKEPRAALSEASPEGERSETLARRTRRRVTRPTRSTATTAPSACTPRAPNTQTYCLHLVANAIVYWNTVYIQRALDELDRDTGNDELAGLTPTLFEHVNPLGT